MTQEPTEANKHRDPEEYKRFLEAAKKVEASDDPKVFDRVFKKVVKPARPATSKAAR
jgi:hypothetical protein